MSEPIREVKPGDAVNLVDEQYQPHAGLVTAVHGTFGGQYTPCINVVYVTDDAAKRDPYGQQVERLSSLQHVTAAAGMPKPGRYWENIRA